MALRAFSFLGWLSLLKQLTVAVAFLPAAVEEVNCSWTGSGLQVSWLPPIPASWRADPDYYELQVVNDDALPILVASTAKTSFVLDQLLPNMVYRIRVRAHAAGRKSMGAGTWGPAGSPVQCASGNVVSPSKVAAPGVETFTMEVMRQSEFTSDVDYLMNHNSGTILGDVGYLMVTSLFAHHSHGGKGPSGVDFNESTMTLYCLDLLKTEVKHTFSTGGDTRFADYQSCDINGDPSNPQCYCDVFIDRVYGGLSVNETCTSRKTGGPCNVDPEAHGKKRMDWCDCNCSSASLAASATYVGMMPVAHVASNHSATGRVATGMWFSHPSHSECMEDELVGDRRADGTQCTWKRRPVARVIRGHEAQAQGWNISVNYTSLFDSVDLAQLLQNEQVIRGTFAAAPLPPWKCDDSAENAARLSKLLYV
mmetsp:Transcript_49553/g.91399  ORF Transcript_49553/g.91399 Transcript_49553/m.91399 type:complete len:423 (+) Transcript_49553:63-1331(+)